MNEVSVGQNCRAGLPHREWTKCQEAPLEYVFVFAFLVDFRSFFVIFFPLSSPRGQPIAKYRYRIIPSSDSPADDRQP